MDEKTLKRISYLESFLLRCSKAYYENDGFGIVDGREITDEEYNAMEAELKSLDPNNKIFTAVGDEISTGFEKGKHSIPMGSQSKCANIEEFKDWWRLLGEKGDLVITYKLDGASLALYCDNGKLRQAITRGDGVIGRIITDNAKKFIGVPLEIDFKGKLAVRGEALLSVEKWKQIDPEALNPRNLGTGIMGREDGEGSENLRFVAFDCDVEDKDFTTKMSKLEWLKENSFSVSPFVYYVYSETHPHVIIEDVENFYKKVNSERMENAVKIKEELFWIDGLVAELNGINLQNQLGSSSGRPKFSTALKFPSPGAETILEDVELNVGHTGAIVPTGLVRPTEIGGTTVSRVTLNNWDYIENMDIAVGDMVKVVKAGDIIPKIVSVVKRSNDRKSIEMPTFCPVCGGNVGKDTNVDGSEAVVLKCLNSSCPAKAIGKIKKLISSLEILEVGDAIIEGMYNAGIVKNVADLFKLESKKKEIAALNVGNGVWGSKRTKTMIDEINKRKELTLPELLGSLGINGLGKRRVQIIMDKTAGKMDNIASWRDGTLVKLAVEAGVPRIAPNIQKGLNECSDVIDDLLSVIKLKEKEKQMAKSGGKLNGKVFVLTGKFSRVKEEIHNDIRAAGGLVCDSLHKDCHYLVQSDPLSTSSKTQKAEKWGIPVISEEDLMEMIGG